MIATLNSDHRSTIVALATPFGESAIGVLRLSGPQAFAVAGSLYRGRCPWGEAAPRQAVVGYFLYPYDEILDEAVWIRYVAPHSYTGEDVVEIMLHGNPWIVLEAQKACVEKGAVLARPGEFTQRAYLNGKMDLNQAEAVNDLIRAHTRLAKSAAVLQLQGRLSDRLGGVHRGLLDLLARVEAAVDHSDLEETFLPSQEVLASLEGMICGLSELLSTASVGKMIRTGLKVAIVGAPNVGKSSLFNMLANEDRAIVTDIPGTTRDTLDVEIQIQGLPFRLVDTAGIRRSTDEVEQEGMRRSQRAIEMADVCVVVFDGQRLPSVEDREMVGLVEGRRALFCINKVEVGHCADAYDFLQEPIFISVRERLNIDVLHERLVRFYFDIGYNPQTEVLLANQRQEMLVRRALEALENTREAVLSGMSEECSAHHLQQGRLCLEEIMGKTTHEDILDRIFSQFCIGK